jgi:hypothetical protein
MKMKLTFERATGDYYQTPYSNPALYGMERVDEIQWGTPDYSFDITCVLRRLSDGTLWYASDSGCSCPSPFEDVWEWDRLFNLDPLAPPKEDYRQPELTDYKLFLDNVRAAFEKLKDA